MIISPCVYYNVRIRVFIIRHVLRKSVDYTGFYFIFFLLSILTSLKTLFSFVEFCFYFFYATGDNYAVGTYTHIHRYIYYTLLFSRTSIVGTLARSPRAYVLYLRALFFFFCTPDGHEPRKPIQAMTMALFCI